MNSEPVWICRGVDETLALGAHIGRAISGGECIGLVGPLGAGKTQLVKGIARGNHFLDSAVTSPTFTLIHEYAGRVRLIHLDLYRLKKPEELAGLGFAELVSPAACVIVEWANLFEQSMPDDMLWIGLESTGTDSRCMKMRARGDASRLLLEKLMAMRPASERV